MPIAAAVLRAHVIDDTNDEITVYLHTGDPGAAGTADRVPAGSLGSATIPANGWTVHASNPRAEVTDDIDFGAAMADIAGISHYSLFKGNVLFATRALDGAAVNVASGVEVVLSGSSIVVVYTSPDN